MMCTEIGNGLCQDTAEASGCNQSDVEVMVLNCQPHATAAVRDRLDALLDPSLISPLEAYEVKVAVGEAVGNAIRHGCGLDPSRYITVRFERTAESLTVEVKDDGPGFCYDEDCCEFPNPVDCGGLGIALMHRLMDEVEIRCDGGTTVRLTKRFRGSP